MKRARDGEAKGYGNFGWVRRYQRDHRLGSCLEEHATYNYIQELIFAGEDAKDRLVIAFEGFFDAVLASEGANNLDRRVAELGLNLLGQGNCQIKEGACWHHLTPICMGGAFAPT